MEALITIEVIEQRILLIRGKKVILDADLAVLYGTTTKRLNEQVKRNADRFPEDFMFQLTKTEKAEVVANCDHLAKLKFSPVLPNAFTEHGAIMVASVLNTKRAIQVSLFVVRAFIKLREMLATHKKLAHKLAELERKLQNHDESIQFLVVAIRQLMAPPEPELPKKRIGFLVHPVRDYKSCTMFM
jgi:phage regulator Rha-like protein